MGGGGGGAAGDVGTCWNVLERLAMLICPKKRREGRSERAGLRFMYVFFDVNLSGEQTRSSQEEAAVNVDESPRRRSLNIVRGRERGRRRLLGGTRAALIFSGLSALVLTHNQI